MLICFRRKDDDTEIIGLALEQWFVQDDVRIHVLIPIQIKEENYCEVEIVYPSKDEWWFPSRSSESTPVGNPLMDEDNPYPLDEETESDLYSVWDDGASRHPEAASRLYSHFKEMIDHYSAEALALKEKVVEQHYKNSLQEAKARGWETDTIQKKPILNPYGDIYDK